MDLTHRAGVHAALGDPQRLQIADALTVGDLTVSDIATLMNMPGNLLAHHLDVLEDAGVVERRTSEGDRRRRYVVLNPTVAGLITHGSEAVDADPLFICTANSARSQFAAALWQERTGQPVESAGTHPADVVNPMAVAIAADFGINLTDATPSGYDDVAGSHDIVISVCDRAAESGIPFTEPHLHWSIPDPVVVGTTEAFVSAFADITERVDRLLVETP
ncbi:ArsR family transcriptional regulator [Actinomycetota bacterium]|jgi:protein-tyrosine-phosphatase/DNA-binding transcriptional ArsR family regulator